MFACPRGEWVRRRHRYQGTHRVRTHEECRLENEPALRPLLARHHRRPHLLTGAEGGERVAAGRGDKVVDQGGKLFTLCLDRKTGKILSRRQAPRPRMERYQKVNSPPSPSAVTDGTSFFIFFADYGIISYTKDGDERWSTPIGPFNNVNGHGSSPIVFEDLVILVCDQDAGLLR